MRVTIRRATILIALLAAGALGTLSSGAQPGRGATAADSLTAPAAQAASSVQPGMVAPYTNYVIKPRDTVHVLVFQETDLETTGRVDKDGTIAFPLLGTAKIGGETVQEATATMTALLREYLVHPQVSVSIVSYFKDRFTVLGQVNRPGTYDMPDETPVDLLQAIGMAGGYSKIANPSHIDVKRIQDGKEMLIRMDAKKILRQRYAGESVPVILPGDTIMVGESIF